MPSEKECFKVVYVPLQFDEESVKESWGKIAPGYNNSKLYKEEDLTILAAKRQKGFTNFWNIGGNPESRVAFKGPGSEEEVFFEGNWIEDDKIACGYPSIGKICNSYWYTLSQLSQDHSVIIVNLMAERDVPSYGQFLPGEEGLNVGEEGLSIQGACDRWGAALKLQEMKKDNEWSEMKVGLNGKTFKVFHYGEWIDFNDGNLGAVSELIKAVYGEMKSGGVVVANCRAGVGRTGTFLTALHFYQMIQKGELDPEKYTLESIVTTLNSFRERRGDVQFVQTDKQFVMLLTLIQKFYKEAIDLQ
ncbi:MAG: hypothetical protein KDK76_00785 [Chlamydiia bacterium]|nr:hypothetical protein [Chlamydiia bacterium]